MLRNAQRALAQGDGLLPPMPSPADPLPVKAEAYGIAYSHPTWMVERWLSRFGEEDTLALLEANNRYRLLGQTICQLSHKECKAVDPLVIGLPGWGHCADTTGRIQV